MYDGNQILGEMEFESNWFSNMFSSLNTNGIHSRILEMVDQLEQLVQQKYLFCLVNIIHELPTLSVPQVLWLMNLKYMGESLTKKEF